MARAPGSPASAPSRCWVFWAASPANSWPRTVSWSRGPCWPAPRHSSSRPTSLPAAQDVDGTTEVAALVVLAAGTLAGAGRTAVAGAIVALTGLLLVEKTRLHSLAARVDSNDLRSGLRFAAMALVILPVLPTGPFGPGIGIRPRELWALVLFFSGLSFAGYLARRGLGPGHGLAAAGALGGLVSSTNVTLTFARTSHADPAGAGAFAAGALAANAMLFPRVLLATSVLNPPLALAWCRGWGRLWSWRPRWRSGARAVSPAVASRRWPTRPIRCGSVPPCR